MPTQHRSRPRTQDRSTASTGEALRSIFNRNFNVVACINLLVMTAYYLMFVTSTAYARATYGASLSSAGLTAGIMVIGCLIGLICGILNTIPYELTCAVSKRVPRLYMEQGKEVERSLRLL